MSQVNKLERDGKVAVLFSPGLGAGWSTWAADKYRDVLIFDAEIAQAVLDDDKVRAGALAETKAPGFYLGGLGQLTVKWVRKGEAFEITEYDGKESVNVIGKPQYLVA